MICPFCSDEVAEGFIVCKGCGANRRANVGQSVAGTIFGVIGLALFGVGWVIFPALLCVFGVWAVFEGQKVKWYRKIA